MAAAYNHDVAQLALTGADQGGSSGVSWGAILAGAVGAAALSLILALLGTGLGLSSISPWSPRGPNATTIGIATIAWITFTQIAASGLGGYLAGRLRIKWASIHADEVYFRDTAHGFLAWAVATLVTAATLASVVGSIVGAGAQVSASAAGATATAASAAGVAGSGEARQSPQPGGDGPSGFIGYHMDSLFRRDSVPQGGPASGGGAAPAAQNGSTDRSADSSNSSEAGRIFVNALRAGSLPPQDARYAGQVVAQRTGLSQQDAEKRVADTFARVQATLNEAEDKARAAADAARKASAYASLWLFISMLIGAFVASVAATYGGRQRDL